MNRLRLIATFITAIIMLAGAGSATAAGNGSADVFWSPKPAFTWGAAAGASIDMTSNDMSTVDFELSFGMRRGWINFLGVGVEADIMVSNSCRSFPIFAELRTNFTNHPTLAFFDLKVGASLNYLERDFQQTGVYTFAGAGINLASSSRFSSHLIIGYTYRERRDIPGDGGSFYFPSLHYATVKIGVCF